MTWMKFAGARGARIRPFAGLYLRTPRRTRFWGWGEPPLSAVSTRATVPAVANPAVDNVTVHNPAVHNEARPWAALGDWLRTAHAMLGSEAVGEDAPSFAPSQSMSTHEPAADAKGGS
jgi:hypothetical protein